MNFLADIHLHSRWSRATSRDLTPETLHKWSMLKGISVVGSADFTHPAWFAELRDKLVPAEQGLYRLRPQLLDGVEEQVPPSCRREVRFLLSVEISSIYKKNGRTRKVHNVVCLPSMAEVEKLNRRLGAIGNLAADGRPILALDSRDLLAICLDVCPEVLFIPAHIWTPHFAALGAGSGFDSLEECFEDLLPYIFAVETGLSSDPLMNSRLSALDRYAMVSNSDAHSAPKLGREASCFDTDLSFPAIYDALRSSDPERFLGTLEFYPEEGKYHLDGHRKCGVCCTPQQTRAAAGRCPACGGKLTVGVLHRVELLADRTMDEAAPHSRPFEYLIPLTEVIGACVGVGPRSKKVQGIYYDLLQHLGPELDILRHVDPDRIAQSGQPLVAEGVRRMRADQITIAAGYDGAYGVIQVFTDAERKKLQQRVVSSAEIRAADVVERLAAEDDSGRVERLLTTAQAVAVGVEFDAEQQQVTRAARGPVAVIAGPGSGKTLSLTQRLAWLMEQGDVEPSRIAAVTLSGRAARQLRRRLQALSGDASAAVVVGTFQHLAQVLAQEFTPASASTSPALSVVDETEALSLLRDVLAVVPEPPAHARKVQRRISRWKALGLRPFQVADDPLAGIYAGYEERLRVCAARDTDDLLLDLLEAIRRDIDLRQRLSTRFAHVLVDEFQDINAVQYELIRTLAGGGQGLFVTGDPDQAIFGFRGADAGFFDRLAQDYADTTIHKLARNYRSSSGIVDAARSALAGAPRTAAGQAPPKSQSGQLSGQPLRLLATDTDADEGSAVAGAIADLLGGASGSGPVRDLNDIAVLTRTTHQADILETCLHAQGLPCRVLGQKRFLQQRGARDAIAFFRYAREPSRPQRLLEALRTGPFDIGASALRKLSAAARSSTYIDQAIASLPTAVAAQVEGLRLAAAGYARRAETDAPADVLRVWQADLDVEASPAFERLVGVAEDCGSMGDLLDTLLLGHETDASWRGTPAVRGPQPRAAVTLATIHASKGLEFPVVFICGVEDGLLPLQHCDGTRPSSQEERRLFYVALTRARVKVILSYARNRRVHGVMEPTLPSPYLVDMPTTQYVAEAISESGAPRL